MSKPYTSHAERTATEARQNGLHRATISYVRNVNSRVRLLQLVLPYAVKFLPGQWLDVHVPSLPEHIGGFTITSTPADASVYPKQDPPSSSPQTQKLVATHRPYFELAIQRSSTNPPAVWLWKDESEILNQSVFVRVGGNFTWPAEKRDLKKVVFVAGGVGINPLISMISHLAQQEQKQSLPQTIKLLYATRLAGETLDQVLFLPRLKRIFQELNTSTDGSNTIDLHLTDGTISPRQMHLPSWMRIHSSRISRKHLFSAIGPSASPKHETAVYICGPPAMTDEFVEILETEENMKGNVFCEKWW